jgi:hypothetical protein
VTDSMGDAAGYLPNFHLPLSYSVLLKAGHFPNYLVTGSQRIRFTFLSIYRLHCVHFAANNYFVN